LVVVFVLPSVLQATFGKVNIDEAKKTCVWDIGRIPKDTTPHLEGKIHFSGGVSMGDVCKPAIQVSYLKKTLILLGICLFCFFFDLLCLISEEDTDFAWNLFILFFFDLLRV
jgi:hypothetical protein